MASANSEAHGRPGWWRWPAVLVPTLLIAFVPIAGLNPAQQKLLAVFLGVIVALVVQPVPMGVTLLVAMTALVLFRILPAAKVLSGFGKEVVWLIFSAFLFARAVTATGFGRRVAFLFVRAFGHNALTLGYSLAAADLVMAPFVPSDTARGGGVIYPVARSLAEVFDSRPGPTARRIGGFLMLVSFHATYTASATFLTGMAANPLIADFAWQIGHVRLTWLKWALASSVPALLSLTIVPLIIYKLYPPEICDTEPAREMARTELGAMGVMRREEWLLVAIFIAVMTGWVSSPWHGVSNAFVALAGVSALLLCRVLSWEDLLEQRRAWDALIWFAPLLMMADALNEAGIIKVFSGAVFSHMSGWPWWLALTALVAGYLYIHYGFASMTAHTTALYPGFLAAALAAGVPPMLAAFQFAFFSNLNASLTHYGTGSAPIYFGDGYVPQGTWWKLGFLISLVNLIFWLGIGSIWWKIVGIW